MVTSRSTSGFDDRTHRSTLPGPREHGVGGERLGHVAERLPGRAPASIRTQGARSSPDVVIVRGTRSGRTGSGRRRGPGRRGVGERAVVAEVPGGRGGGGQRERGAVVENAGIGDSPRPRRRTRAPWLRLVGAQRGRVGGLIGETVGRERGAGAEDATEQHRRRARASPAGSTGSSSPRRSRGTRSTATTPRVRANPGAARSSA